MAVEKSTRLENKRSCKLVYVVSIFVTQDEKTNWETMNCYYVRSVIGGKTQYIYEFELNKWSVK